MVMFADQYYRQFKAYPRVPYGIQKLVFTYNFDAKHGGVSGKVFWLKNATHGSRMNTDVNLVWPSISSLLVEPIFVALNLF